jgi:mannose-6-phosphate isomerase-like protein (cupin superfamily)
MEFNEQEYLQSNQLDTYCLGLLGPAEAKEVERLAATYPSIRAELDRLRQAMADDALARPVMPRPELKSRIMLALSQLDQTPAFDLNELPLINAYSNVNQWQRTVASIQPPPTYRNLFGHILRQDAQIEQFLLWVKQSIKSEVHHNEQESFLILEGSCECSFGGELVQLTVGDYLDVPIDLEHTVRVMSNTPVKAIIQRLKIVAA